MIVVVVLGEKKTQPVGLTCDVNSSLIYIEVTEGPDVALELAAKRMGHLLRGSDSIVLLETACVLVLPATPFSGAQVLASRLLPFLSGLTYDLQVYHGATALLILQNLREAGARIFPRPQPAQVPSPTAPVHALVLPPEPSPLPAPHAVAQDALPYLAFLARYPAPKVLQLIPYERACYYQCVPLGVERHMLTLATCTLLNHDIIKELCAVTHRDIFQIRCERSIIDEVLCYWRRLEGSVERDTVEWTEDDLCDRSHL